MNLLLLTFSEVQAISMSAIGGKLCPSGSDDDDDGGGFASSKTFRILSVSHIHDRQILCIINSVSLLIILSSVGCCIICFYYRFGNKHFIG